MKTANIMQEEWDYLIILDACRYDYFEQVWRKYLDGVLEKRISVGSGTKEWRNKSFVKRYDDVIYISTNPYIASVPSKGFSAAEHFFEVHDLWLHNWDKDKGTVLPETVSKRAVEIINANMDKRAIIHYIQPHEPYLGQSISSPGYSSSRPEVFFGLSSDQGGKDKVLHKLLYIFSALLYYCGIRGRLFVWKLRELLRMPPANPMDAVRRRYGKEGLRRAYRENLEIVLKCVAELVQALSGRIIVTADHGEMLGESFCYGHWSRSSKKLLREIPWLVIDKGKKRTEPPKTQLHPKQTQQRSAVPDEQEAKGKIEEQVQQRLRALGYFD